MDLYFTSKNTGPSWHSDPVHLLYFGPSFEQALEAVDRNFRRYEKSFTEGREEYAHLYSVLPQNVEWEMVRFFAADGWWFSIVKVVIEPPDQPSIRLDVHHHEVTLDELVTENASSGVSHVHRIHPRKPKEGVEPLCLGQTMISDVLEGRQHYHVIHWNTYDNKGITSPPIFVD